MVYSDVPVTDFSSNLIGNDIDLTVKAKGGSRVVYPNNLSSADRYNNQEQITLTKSKLSDLIGSGEKTLEIRSRDPRCSPSIRWGNVGSMNCSRSRL